jgi:hypothetical protein
MTEDESSRLGRELAGLILDSPPILTNETEVLDYLNSVETILSLNRMEDSTSTILLRARCADPKFAAALKKKQAKFWKGVNHRRSLPKQGAAARRKQGAQTLSAVVKAWHSLSNNVPKHNRAALIARRCKISDRAVRFHLKGAGLI